MKYAKSQYVKAGQQMSYPISKLFDDEPKRIRSINFSKWKQIQPEIQAIARDVIFNMELVKLAVNEFRSKQKSKYFEKRVTDAIFALFKVGTNRFEEWLDACDKGLNFEYSNQVFLYEKDNDNHHKYWIPFSVFLDKEKMQSYFNACILQTAMNFIMFDQETTELFRSAYGHIPQFKKALQEKFEIMDYYCYFKNQWKGGEYYSRALFL